MRRLFQLAILLLALGTLPILSLAQNTKDAKDPAPVDESKIRAGAVKKDFVQGKLTDYDIDGDVKKFTVQYAHQEKKLNPQQQQRLKTLTLQYQQALARGDKAKAKDIYDQGVDATAKLYDITEVPIDFQFVGEKTMHFRTLQAPLGDDGKPKKLTAAEDLKARGDPKLPGYLFDPKTIDKQMIVRLYFDKEKLKAADPKSTKDAKKEENKDEKGDKPAEAPTYPTNMILIIPDDIGNPFSGSNPFIGGGTTPKKGKN